VIARTSVLQYADAPPSIPQIAAELNVGAVMECSVRYAGTAIVVTAQLIDPDTNSHLWSDTYPGDMSDLSTVFAMQADIAMNIANAIGAEFSVEEQASIEKIPTASIEAYGYYLAALEFSSLFDTRNLELMDRAIEVDPNFALAHATRSFGLAGRLYYGGFIEQLNVTRDDAEREVLETATRALELDPDLGLAYRARALIHEINWRWADAEQAHELAVQSDQNNPAVLQGLASLKRRIGEYDEGVKLAERARELDPANFNSYHLLGIANMYARNYDSALAAFETAITINPTNPPTYIGMAIVQNALGRTADTIESLEELDRLRGAGPLNVAILATGYANADRPAEAERFFLELEGMSEERSVGSANLAMAHIALGNEEEALRWFRQAIDDRALVDGTALSHMKANHWRDPLLDTTAFQQLRDRVGAL
jgi:tetratricopeptide (TPR) repeat protein